MPLDFTQTSGERVIDPATGLFIVPSRDNKLTEFSRKLLLDFYLLRGETPQQGLARASKAWSNGNDALAQRLYDAASRGWFMFASPVLSNAPLPGQKIKGLPISCFLSLVPDSLEGLIDHSVEFRWLSVLGGGVGGHWSAVRAVSDKAPGPIPFIHTVDADMEAYKQGKVRRGSYAAYMDVSHPDILEFLNIRVITTGDASRKCHSAGFHHAINITDAFMQAVMADASWDLIDPHDGKIFETLQARDLWEQILETRYRTGEPYLTFIDTANKHLPDCQKHMGLRINGSNLCEEIFLTTSEDRTAVCCLSSLNAETYDEWKDTDLVSDLIEMLDNVLEYFINNAPDPLEKAKFSALSERSLGLGVMGFHSYLQKHMIPFESKEARELNKSLFKQIANQSLKATERLAIERGEFPDAEVGLHFESFQGDSFTVSSSTLITVERHGHYHTMRAFQIELGDVVHGFKVNRITGRHNHTGRRNAHLLAIAPNANSAILLGTSPSIEPSNANAYVHQTRAGSWPVKNKHLVDLLESKKKNTDEVWQDIIVSKGSVQHLDFLSDQEKAVFKTAIEIDQMWLINHAADRQPYICQGQSLNLFFPPRVNRGYFNIVHIEAWKKGLKSLYYTRTTASNRADNVSQKIERKALKGGDDVVIILNEAVDESPNEDGCISCQG